MFIIFRLWFVCELDRIRLIFTAEPRHNTQRLGSSQPSIGLVVWWWDCTQFSNFWFLFTIWFCCFFYSYAISDFATFVMLQPLPVICWPATIPIPLRWKSEGDRVVSVNGEPIAGRSYDQVVHLIQLSPSTLCLEVTPKQYDTLQLVRLKIAFLFFSAVTCSAFFISFQNDCSVFRF